jgi:hypothetical protein
MSPFRRLFRSSSHTRDDIRADVDEEIRFHLDMRARELMARGESPEAARQRAQRQFGEIEAAAAAISRLYARQEQRMRISRFVDELRQDVAYGWRSMNRNLGLTAIALFTIALGIAMSAVMFAIVHAVLIAPLPYHDADRLVTMRLSVPDYEDLRRTGTVFEETGIWASNLYIPFLWMYVHVRTAGDPIAVLPSIRSAVRRADPQVTVAAPRSMQDLMADSSADPRFLASLISTFGVLALLLAAIGLYGVMAYTVARQAREIGIRVALGARPVRVCLHVVIRAMLLTVPGLALGLVSVLATGRVIDALLYGVSPADPVALSVVAAVFVTVALVASAVPARRAASIDPVVVLREG